MSKPIVHPTPKFIGPIICVDDYMHARRMKEENIETRFLYGLLMRNRIFKATYSNRLDDAIDMLLAYTAQMKAKPLRLLDAGCSSGISTLELHSAFLERGIDCRTVGVDLALNAIQVKRNDGASILFDQEGNILQLDRWGVSMTWSLPPPKKIVIKNLSFTLWGMAMLCLHGGNFRKALNRNVAGMQKREVSLVSSKLSNVKGLEIRQENILEPRNEPLYDIVRVANVLNLNVLAKDAVMTMLNALKKRVVDGGYLMVLRSDADINNGTLFSHENNLLVPVAQLNTGWEGTPHVQRL